MNTTVPWAPVVLLIAVVLVVLGTAVAEYRARRRHVTSGWKAPGW